MMNVNDIRCPVPRETGVTRHLVVDGFGLYDGTCMGLFTKSPTLSIDLASKCRGRCGCNGFAMKTNLTGRGCELIAADLGLEKSIKPQSLSLDSAIVRNLAATLP